MLEIWQLVIPTLVLIFVQSFTFISLMDSIYSRKKTIFLTIVFTSICGFVCIFGCIIGDNYRNTGWSLITLTLPSLVYYFYISKYKGIRFFTTYCVSDISIAAMDYLAYTLCIWIFNEGDTFWSFAIRDVFIIMAGVCVNLFLKPHYSVALRELKKGWPLMFLVTLLSYVFMSLLSSYPSPIHYRPEDAPISVIAMAFLETVIIVIIYLISSMLAAQRQKTQKDTLSIQLQMAKEQYNTINSSVEQTKRMRHDMKHHLHVIQSLCDAGDVKRLKEYVYDDGLNYMGNINFYCKNYVANLILSYYAEQAEKCGINFECNASLPEKCQINDSTMTILLGNALSNAQEACGEETHCDRYIKVKMSYKQNTLLLHVKNTCNVEPKMKDGMPYSNRGEEHGIGTLSIKRLTDEAGGRSKWNYSNKIIELDVALPDNNLTKTL